MFKLLFLIFATVSANWKGITMDSSNTDFSFPPQQSLGRSQTNLCDMRFQQFPIVMNHNNKLKKKGDDDLSWIDTGLWYGYSNAKYVCQNHKWNGYKPTHAKNLKLIFKDSNGNNMWDDCSGRNILGGAPDGSQTYKEISDNSYACVRIVNGQGEWP